MEGKKLHVFMIVFCNLKDRTADVAPCCPSALDKHYWVFFWEGENKVPHITSNMFLFSQECFSQCFAARLFEVLTSRNAAEWGKGAARGIRRMGE